MCKWCRRIRSWCKAFTRLERCLSLLQCLALGVFVPMLALLVLHLHACAHPVPPLPVLETEECTWKPGVPTASSKVYFEHDNTTKTKEVGAPEIGGSVKQQKSTTSVFVLANLTDGGYALKPETTTKGAHGSGHEGGDGDEDPLAPFGRDEPAEAASERQRAILLALVKMKPPHEVVFGCTLTAVSRYWALTTASCVEAVEETDSLDSYAMMEDYDTDRSRTHAVADLRVHPAYSETNRSYDAAALRSADSLLRGGLRPARFAHALHAALLAPGDRVQVLTFGPFRGAGATRAVSAGALAVLPRGACAAAAGGALRHLWAARRESVAGCGTAARCAGAAAGGAAPCAPCGGAPLVLREWLLALAPHDAPCGDACDPFLFIPLTVVKPWLDSFIRVE